MGKGKGRNKGNKAPQVDTDTEAQVTEVLAQVEQEVESWGDTDPMEVEGQDLPLLQSPPALSPEREQYLRTRMAQLREELALVEGELATAQVHILVTSTVDGPVALVRKVFLSQVEGDNTPGKRSKVVRMLVGMGVAPNTAKTQYQHLSKALRDPQDPKHGALVGDLATLREVAQD